MTLLYCLFILLISLPYFIKGEQIRVEALPAKPPHILLVVADDLGFNDVPWHNPTVVAPALRKLARQGVILEQSYVQPVCTPTRSAIMTGKYLFEIGRQHGVIHPLIPTGLNTSLPILPNYLKPLGYSTHAVGKWHLGFCDWSFTPTERGFDTFRGFYNGAENYFNHTRNWAFSHKENHVIEEKDEDAIRLGYDFRHNKEVDWRPWKTYSTHVFASAVEEILDSNSASNPKFIYLAFQSVHAPLQVPKKYLHPYKDIKNDRRRTLLGMVTAMDEAIGRVVQKLKETNHYENTVIIFTSDNGGPTSQGANNWPLRGNKSTIWEGGTRAAGFVHSPLLTNGGTVSGKLIHATDWLSTIVSLAGGLVPNDTSGYDQWGIISGRTKRNKRKEIVYNIDYTYPFITAIRDKRYKLIVGHPKAGEWTPPPEDEQDAQSLLYADKTNIRNNTLMNGIKRDNATINKKFSKKRDRYKKKETTYHYSKLPPKIRKFCLQDYKKCAEKYNLPKALSLSLGLKQAKRVKSPFQVKNTSTIPLGEKLFIRTESEFDNNLNETTSKGNLTETKEQLLLQFKKRFSMLLSDSAFNKDGFIMSLYDLRHDPEERRDMFRERPDVVKRLADRLFSHQNKYVPPDDPRKSPAGYPRNFHGVWSPGWC